MPPAPDLLALAERVALSAGRRLAGLGAEERRYEHAGDFPREIKARADVIVEREILDALAATGLPVLSEEAGEVRGDDHGGRRFIVDPLDGTFNFVREFGPSAVSIALWEGEAPVFGVVFHLQEGVLYSGGPGLGATRAGVPIRVASTRDRARASLCTGIPARLDIDAADAGEAHWRLLHGFGKVRMIGSAAASLTAVARGAADVYAERNIMLWDVAAGIAIVEGAGGVVRRTPGTLPHALDVVAGSAELVGAVA